MNGFDLANGLVIKPVNTWRASGTRTLLLDVVGNPTPEKLDRVRQMYLSDKRYVMNAIYKSGSRIGLLGTEYLSDAIIAIRHLVIARRFRRCGYGRIVLNYLSHGHPDRSLIALTDYESVDFYRKCGFSIRSMGAHEGGNERFECRRQAISP